MRGYDVISELYHGNLRPCDRGFYHESLLGSAMEALSMHEAWLNERLTAEQKQRFEELMSCHNTIVETMAYENFRTGMQLGVMLVMDAVSANHSVLYDL